MIKHAYVSGTLRGVSIARVDLTITHLFFVDDKLFYQQKGPVPVNDDARFIKYARQYVVYIPGQEPSKIETIRTLTQEEKNKIEKALQKNNRFSIGST